MEKIVWEMKRDGGGRPGCLVANIDGGDRKVRSIELCNYSTPDVKEFVGLGKVLESN